MDLAKKHVTRKAHADVGMRVCDYPTIQVTSGRLIENMRIRDYPTVQVTSGGLAGN